MMGEAHERTTITWGRSVKGIPISAQDAIERRFKSIGQELVID
jgi:hypothetical protein